MNFNPTDKEHTVNVELLPATQIDPNNMTAEPLSEIEVGQIVATYSRGSWRVAQVTKVGPKRVEVIYTTQGAWKEAQRIYEHETSPSYVSYSAEAAKTEAKNYDFMLQEINPATAVYNVVSPTQYTPEQVAAKTAKYVAEIAGRTKEQYLADIKAASLERKQRTQEKALAGGVTQFVHVTTKNAKRSDIFGIV